MKPFLRANEMVIRAFLPYHFAHGILESLRAYALKAKPVRNVTLGHLENDCFIEDWCVVHFDPDNATKRKLETVLATKCVYTPLMGASPAIMSMAVS
jgi:hypothetical protein